MQPIRLIPWQGDFIAPLADHLARTRKGRLADLIAVFPHRRPGRYLIRALAEHPEVAKPLILPETLSFAEFTTRLARGSLPPRRTATSLDQVGLLYDVVAEMRGAEKGLLAELPLDRTRFFPWGTRLAGLLEELLRHVIEPANLTHIDAEVLPWAAALLGHLGEIFTAYLTALDQRGWTTPGLDCFRVARNLDRAVGSIQDKEVVVAGYYALSGGEEAVFKRLWRDDRAVIFWHGDPALAGGGKHHWSAIEHDAWRRRWGAKVEILPGLEAEPATAGPCACRFYQGFDVHSQLKALEDELDNAEESGLDDAAVVLPTTSLLMPVLHHLPEAEKEVNISMGYPLDRSAVGQLFATIIRLQETASADGRYYWRELINLFRHPYLKMLELDGAQPLRLVLHAMEAALRGGDKFVDPLAIITDEMFAEVEADQTRVRELILKLLNACLTGFAGLTTLRDLAASVRRVGGLLAAYGGGLWHKYLIDAECLNRLMTTVTGEITASAISSETYRPRFLFTILRGLMEAQRVPFEPEPLSGLQVLGFLESRLLTFKKLYILDATENRLPGKDSYDPLLPDPLRGLLSLPDNRERDHVAAYNFYRLVSGAAESVIFYQSGARPGIFDEKSVRSRFVEELLWEMEKEAGKIIKPGPDFPVKSVRFPVAPLPPGSRAIPKSPAIREALAALLDSPGLSSTALDNYLTCPARFFLQHLCKLSEVEEVAEDGDPRELGEIVHDVLQIYFQPRLNRLLKREDLPAEELLARYTSALKESKLYRRLPYDQRAALEMGGRIRLKSYLDNFPETTILVLEKEANRRIESSGRSISFYGRVDRIDEREEGLLVLDYKTGGLKRPLAGFFSDEPLRERMAAWQPGYDQNLLSEVADRLKSIQLPLYLFLADDPTSRPHDAAYVELKEAGKEIPLFGPKLPPEERREILTRRIPELLDFLTRHLLLSESFTPRPGKHCDWCAFTASCGARA